MYASHEGATRTNPATNPPTRNAKSDTGFAGICRRFGAILPNVQSNPSVSIQYSAETSEINGVPVPGAVALLVDGVIGDVFEYVVESGRGGFS